MKWSNPTGFDHYSNMNSLWDSFVCLNKEVVERIVWSFCSDYSVTKMIQVNRSTSRILNICNYSLKSYISTTWLFLYTSQDQRSKLRITSLALDEYTNEWSAFNELYKLPCIINLKLFNSFRNNKLSFTSWKNALISIDLSHSSFSLGGFGPYFVIGCKSLKRLKLYSDRHSIYRTRGPLGAWVPYPCVRLPNKITELDLGGYDDVLNEISLPRTLPLLDLNLGSFCRPSLNLNMLHISLIRLRIDMDHLKSEQSTLSFLICLKFLYLMGYDRNAFKIHKFPSSLELIRYENCFQTFTGPNCRQQFIFYFISQNRKT